MTEITSPQASTVEQNLTPEIVKSKLQIALSKTEQSIQLLHDAEKELVYNEDNLELVSQFLKNAKAAKALVESERKKLKEPSLQEGKTIDAGAKLLDTELDTVIAKANVPYQKLCAEVERKQREAEAEVLRVKTIRDTMDKFKIDYSLKISEAKTSKELVEIERRINLETANKSKYQEFLTEFSENVQAIRSLIAGQKEKVRELEALELQASHASENGLDEQYLEIQDKKEALESKIAENRINLQETALSQATNATASATVILPLIPKGSRKLWKFQVVDWKAAEKAKLTKIIIDEEKVGEILKKKRDLETEVIEDGIRYFIEKRF